ncbi:MAG: hypothetical protein R6X13_12120 [bacterium]
MAAAAAVFCLASACAAQPPAAKLVSAAVLGRVGNTGPATDRNVEATVEEAVTLYAFIAADRGSGVEYFCALDTVEVGGKRVRVAGPPDRLPVLRLAWFDISPVPSGYVRTPAGDVPFAEARLRDGAYLPVEPRAGTYRFRVRARIGQDSVSSPGIEPRADPLLKQVRRVSLRENRGGGDAVDWMTMLFNTAWVWGSTSRHVANYIAADCQDMVIYGLNRAGQILSYDEHIHVVRPDRLYFAGFVDGQGNWTDKRGRAAVVKARRGDVIRYVDIPHYGAIYSVQDTSRSIGLDDSVIQTLSVAAVVPVGRYCQGEKTHIQLFRF